MDNNFDRFILLKVLYKKKKFVIVVKSKHLHFHSLFSKLIHTT